MRFNNYCKDRNFMNTKNLVDINKAITDELLEAFGRIPNQDTIEEDSEFLRDFWNDKLALVSVEV
jgi:hypothetical protein